MSIARKIGNLGTALDSATLSTFLSKGTTDGEFDTIAWGDVTGKPSYIDSSLATQLFDSAYVQLRQSAVSSGGLDSAAVTTLIDSSYVANRAGTGSSGFIMYNYNATSGQTAFQDSDTAGNVLSYTADGILVYYNGLLLADEDYTATDGAAVTLTEGADSGAQITIGKWNLTGSGSSGGSSAVWYGDRALSYNTPYGTKVIDYFDITTPGNAASFGTYSAEHARSFIVSDATYSAISGGTLNINNISYNTIATTGNALDFGDLTVGRREGRGGSSDGTYGIYWGGNNNNAVNTMDYITIASPGNATDFGDTFTSGTQAGGATNDATRGIASLGYTTSLITDIRYVTIATPGNASDFGDMNVAAYNAAPASDETYAIWAGGENVSWARMNDMQYVTIQTPSNATDFGDLLAAISYGDLTSNSTYAVMVAGNSGSDTNVIQYVTIQTPSNAIDFGDLTVATSQNAATSGSPS